MTRRRLATIAEVADYLQVAERTVRAWRVQGRGPKAVKVGGALRWEWHEVDAWLAKQPQYLREITKK